MRSQEGAELACLMIKPHTFHDHKLCVVVYRPKCFSLAFIIKLRVRYIFLKRARYYSTALCY